MLELNILGSLGHQHRLEVRDKTKNSRIGFEQVEQWIKERAQWDQLTGRARKEALARVCGYAIKIQWANCGRRPPILHVCVKELRVKGPMSSRVAAME